MNPFQALVEREKRHQRKVSPYFTFAPEPLIKMLKEEVEQCTDEAVALETLERLCPKKYRARFKIKAERRGGVGRSYDKITLVVKARRRAQRKVIADLKNIWLNKGDYYKFAKDIDMSEKVLHDLVAEWRVEEVNDKQEQIRADQEALERAITMKMEGISNCIDKLIDAIEKGIDVMPDEAFSPKAIQALVSAAEGLQKMRNLEEGRPTSITGAAKLTPKNIRERLEKLQRAGVAIEITPDLLEEADTQNPQ